MINKVWKLAAVTICFSIASPAHAATTWSAQDYDLYPGDFNGDHVTDILFLAKDPSMPSGVAYSFALNGPPVALATMQTWGSNYLGLSWNANVSTVVVGDFNGDGASDILLQSKVPGDSFVLLANPSGSFSGQLFTTVTQGIPYSWLQLTWSADHHKIQAGDFDGDGRMDLFLQATSAGDTSAIVFADGNGQFSGATQVLHDGDLGFKWSTKNSVISVGNFGGPIGPYGRATADLLIQGIPTTVMIDYDVTIPIPVYKPGSFGLMLSNGGVTPFSIYSTSQLWNRIDANGVDWSPQFYNVVVGDFLYGDGISDVLLQAKTSSRPSYLIARTEGSSTPFGSKNSVATNVSWSADSSKLLVGSFDTGAGDGLYFQVLAPSGNNSYSNDVSGPYVSTTSHDGAQYTNIFPTTVAGRMGGAAGVSLAGAATYSVPLDLPNGINGLTPRLAIAYNSTGGPGLLGPRWDLVGISSIRRCAATLAQDGVFDNLTLLPTDRYCLEGNKLHLTAGTQGGDGSQYRTELDNFSLVIAHGSAGVAPYTAPAWFEVKRKDGTTYEYGVTVGHPTYSGTPMTWSLTKIRDRAGNYITFSYSMFPPNAGLGLIDTIQYTANDSASISPSYTIKFNYATDIGGFSFPVFFSGFAASGQVKLSTVLANVQISYSNSVIRSYNFGYEPSGSGSPGRPLLKSIQECGTSTSECLAPTRFDWSTGAAGWNGMQGGTQYLSAVSNLRLMDMNGDGRDDAVFYDSGSGQWMIMWGSPSGLGAAVPTGATSPSNYLGRSAGPSDVNGDGRMDLLINNGGTWYVLRYTSSGTFSYSSLDVPAYGTFASMADINGDGYQDLLTADSNNIYVSYQSGDGSGSFSTSPQAIWSTPYGAIQDLNSGTRSSVNRWVDFDGDGRDDVSIKAGGHYYMLFSDGYSFTPWPYAREAPIFGYAMNNDKCTDVVFGVAAYGGIDYVPAPSGCWRNFIVNWSSGPPTTHAVGIDWMGSGVQQLLFFGPGGTNYTLGWYASMPASSFGFDFMARLPVSVAINPAATQIFAADVNGDGLQDLVWVDPSTGTLQYQLHAGSQPELMTTITDGYGNVHTIDYEPTSGGHCVTQNDGSIPPLNSGLRRSITTRYVVCGITSNDGLGGNYTLSYSYANPTDNVQGRGYAGFERRVVTDNRTGISHEENYYLAFPYTGIVAYSVDKQSNGTKISEVNASVAQVVTGSGYSASYFPYVSTATNDIFEVGGTRNGAWITRQTSSVTSVDGYGNVTDTSNTAIDKDTSSPRYGQSTVVRTVTAYSNDTASWCFGLPTNVQATTTLPDGSSQTRTQSASVSACRVTQRTVEPNVPALKVVANYTYDDSDPAYIGPKCGNVSRIETVGSNSAGAALAARTVTFNYGSQCRLPETVTDAFGNQAQRGYRYDLGVVSSETDANGLTTSYQYDSFGRKTLSVGPDGTSMLTTYSACTLNNNYCGATGLRLQVETTERDVGGNAMRTDYQLSDSYGRTRFVRSQRSDGAWNIVQTTYDALGRVATKSVPYVSSSNGYTQFGYDVVGRQTSAQLYNASNTLVRGSSVTYAGRTQTFRDPRGYDTVKLFDVTGQVRKVTDPTVSAPSLSGSMQFDYTYESGGVLKTTVTDAAGNQFLSRSNLSGFKTQSVDPDMGTWSYEYDSFGELTRQTDAKSQVLTFDTYDVLGRQTARREPEGSTVWVWGSAGDNSASAKYIGKLKQVCFVPNQTATNCSGATYSEIYTFDAVARPSNTNIAISGDNIYNIGYSYDSSTGLLDKTTYPGSVGSPLVVKREYQYGVPTKATDYTTGSAGTIFWQLNATDAMGHLTDESLGGGMLRVVSGYDATTGLLSVRQSGTGGSTTNKQNLAYLWDANGNLKQRTDNNQAGLREEFFYDEMNRLDYSQRNGTTNLDVTINAIGNITYKSDVGSYGYPASGAGSVRPHAATSAGSNSYLYDANGNMSTRNGSSISWTSYNMPSTIGGGGQSSAFSYAPDRSRFKQVATYATGTETTYYIGGVMEKLTLSSGVTAYRHYIAAGSNTVVHTRWSNGAAAQTIYVTTDSLGSSSAVVDQNGALVASESFGAYGARRASTWTGAPTSGEMSAIGNATRHGYTGHEHLDNLGLINMNGRVQDPVLGRFISADPFTDDTFGTQGFNRYSYVGNRPLTFTDPTGFMGPGDDAGCGLGLGSSCTPAGLFRTGKMSGWRPTVPEHGLPFVYGSSGPPIEDISWAIGNEIWKTLTSKNESKRNSIQVLHYEQGEFTPTNLLMVFDENVFINGMNCNLKCSKDIAKHEMDTLMHISHFDLVHIPSLGFLLDLARAAGDKIGLTSNTAKQLASVISQAGPSHWYVHSYGGVAFAEAIRILDKEGSVPKGLTVTFLAAANNEWATDRIMRHAGVTRDHYTGSPYDLVPHLVGLNGNPLLWIVDILASPTLFFSSISPHHYPPVPPVPSAK